MAKNQLIRKLKEIDVIKNGNFVLKSGKTSNLYFDFRKVISYPKIFSDLSYQMSKLVGSKDVVIAGVPIGAIPYACSIASILDLPMIMIRESKKEHGTGNIIEGDNFGRDIVLVEDVVMTGDSLMKIVKILEGEGKVIRKIIVILDRGDNIEKFKAAGYDAEALFKIDELDKVVDDGKLLVRNKFTETLMKIIKNKKSNLIVSLDMSDPFEIIEMIELIGEHICGIKLHLDIIDFDDDKSFGWDSDTFCEKMIELKERFKLFIIEDRKFADIPFISCLQMDNFFDFIDAFTTHCISGEMLIQEFNKKNKGLLLIHKLSSDGNLIDNNYSNKVRDMVEKYDNVVGIIGQEKISNQYLTFVPGVNIESTVDKVGQIYKKPCDNGDVFIVGRGIYLSPDPLSSVIEYKNLCWKAFRY